MTLPANPTGADLVAAIERRAAEQGVRPFMLARLISSDPRKWLRQTPNFNTPKAQTIARVAALLAGEPIPPAPPNNFQAAERRSLHRVVSTRPVDADELQRVDREPCFKCGVRGDIGCRHQPKMQAALR